MEITDVEGIKNITGYQEYNGVPTNFIPIVYSYNGSDRTTIWVSGNTLNFISAYKGNVYATIQYTKTTDQASS